MPRNQHESARIIWRDDNLPVSVKFDDPYFSNENGLHEARHVFLAGNGLPARFCDGFHIAELGFGTGLNLLATWQAWRESGVSGHLNFTSFEAYPMRATDMQRALAAFPDLAPLAGKLLRHWEAGETRFSLDGIEVRVLLGDAGACLPDWPDKADAWFLDGFAPAQNPALWAQPLMAEVARHTALGGTLATYTAAGHVRRTLSNVGFTVERRPGFGRKRHMTVGVKSDANPSSRTPPQG